jgi:hypothetical protein
MNKLHRRLSYSILASILALLVGGIVGCGNATKTSDSSTSSQPDTKRQQLHGGGCETINHSVNINTQSDLTPYASKSCFKIKGDLIIRDTTGIVDLSELYGLRAVSGYINIGDNTALKKVKFPKLRKIKRGLIMEGNTALKYVKFRKLYYVGTDVQFFNDTTVKKIVFKRLYKVGGEVLFAGLDGLKKLRIAKLKKVGGRFIFQHSDRLRELCLARLTKVRGDFIVHFNGKLKIINAPWLRYVGGDIELERNPKLAGAWMRNIAKVGGDIKVVYNFKLPECKVQRGINSIWHIGGTVTVSDNQQRCTRMALPSYRCAKLCYYRHRHKRHGHGNVD